MPNFKQFSDEVLVIPGKIKVINLGKCYQQGQRPGGGGGWLKAEADNTNNISNITQIKWKKKTTLKMS